MYSFLEVFSIITSVLNMILFLNVIRYTNYDNPDGSFNIKRYCLNLLPVILFTIFSIVVISLF